MVRNIWLLILASELFCLLGAICAFLITYEQYKKHLLQRKQVFLVSLRMGFLTFLFFTLFIIFFLWVGPKLSLFRPR